MTSSVEEYSGYSSARAPLTIGSIVAHTISLPLGEFAVNKMANSFETGLDSLKSALSLKETLPNLNTLLTVSNFQAALLAIHLGASAIDFPDQTSHPDKSAFVRTVAAFDNFLHHEPDSNNALLKSIHKGIQNTINLTAPVAVHSAPDLLYHAGSILQNKEEHPILSKSLIFLGVMGGLHLVNDVAKIAAKYIETTRKKEIEHPKKWTTRKKNLNPEWKARLDAGKKFQNDQRKSAVDKHKKAEQAGEDYLTSQTSIGPIDYLKKHPEDVKIPATRISIRALSETRVESRKEESQVPNAALSSDRIRNSLSRIAQSDPTRLEYKSPLERFKDQHKKV